MNPSSDPNPHYDVVILGAGGAGLFCAIHAGRRGRRVLVLDHATKLGGKILISGGGRCNFTNLGAGPANYRSQNPHFAKSALSRFRPSDFIAMVEAHGIAYHEKKLGQQFCDTSAQEIVQMLKTECEWAGVEIRLGCKIENVSPMQDTSTQEARYRIQTSHGEWTAHSLVIATGGLSIPKIGATGFGYEIAKQFGLKLVDRAPALDGFVFSSLEKERFGDLSGISADCVMSAGGLSFRENVLFTHAGLSGPVSLQASLHWYPGDSVWIDFLPGHDFLATVMNEKKKGSRVLVRTLLSQVLASRLADRLCDLHFPGTLPLAQISEKSIEAFCELLHHYEFKPPATVGYNKAEVTRGGVDTEELSSKTLEAKKAPGLYFIGEVVDVTGWLGGYNFQWAWASGWAAGQVV